MDTIITNKFFRTVTVLLLLTLNGAAFAGTAEDCTYNAQNQVNTDMEIPSGGGHFYDEGGMCMADPSHRRVKAYKIGLCTELPYNTNYKTVCDFIFESDTPVELIAEKGVSSPVSGIGNVTLVEDKLYTHSVLLISITKAVKAVFEFDSPKVGATGTGSYCWSNGASENLVSPDDRATWSAECGTLNEANPQFNPRVGYFMSNVVGDGLGFERNFPNWDGGWTNIVLSNEDDMATFPSDWSSPEKEETNAVYTLSGRGIDGGTGITITPDTTNLDLQFKVSWGGGIQWSIDVENGCEAISCIYSISNGGFDFSVTAD